MRVGMPLASGAFVRTFVLAFAILSLTVVPAFARAQVDSEDALEESEATSDEVTPDEATPAEEEPAEAGASTEVSGSPEPQATRAEASEPEPAPPPPATKKVAEVKIYADSVTVVTSPAPPEVEKPAGRLHDGFYLRGSLGPGWLWTSFSDGLLAGGTIRGNGGGGDIQLGGTFTPGLVVGGGLFLTGMEHEDVRPAGEAVDDYDPGNVGMVAIGPFVDYFPDPKRGLHFGGMVGLGVMGFETRGRAGIESPYDEDARSGSGGAIGAWVGYDWWVGPEWSLGGQLRYLGVAVENPDYDWKGAADVISVQFTALYH
jgi:hypothetical protein